MAEFENVSIFSQTTAEISKEYVDKFHEPNIMPNYLYDLTVKNDVELFSRNGVYEVKGSWVSVNRVHSFLGKFLLSYGESRIEALTSPPETTCTKEDDDDDDWGSRYDDVHFNKKHQINATDTDSSKNLKKLLRISVCNPDNASYINQVLPTDKLLVKSTKQTPAPVVLYAGFKDTTKEMESHRKTLEVLKNVYKMEQNYQIAQSVTIKHGKRKEVGEECAPAQVIMVIPTENEAPVEDEPSYSPSETERLDQQNQQKVVSEEDVYTEDLARDEEERKPSIPMSLGCGSSVEPQMMTKLKEPGISEFSGSGTKKPSFVKTISEEQTAAKRKKVESIADTILSQVPNKEKNNVCKVGNEHREDSTSLVKQERVEDNYDDGDEIEPVEDNVSLCNDDDDNDDDDEYGPSENDDENSNESEEDKSSFKPDAADKDTPVDTEAESADDCEQGIQPTADMDYIPDEKITTTGVKAARKMKTRSKVRDECVSLPEQSPKKGRGRPRKGFPMKLETKESMKAMKSETGKSKNTKKKPVKGSKSKKGKRKHRRSESTGEVFCSKCPYFAFKQSHLREHERRVHITKRFKCDHCERIFGFGKDLKRHLKTHLKPENCCDICGKLYKGVKSLIEHRRTHDDGYVKPEFECEICKKCFSTKYVLAYHIKSEHLGMKRTFMCPTCGKSFSQKNSYVQHANVHMGLKPYKCEFCDKTFSYEKSLKEHRFMHDDIRRFKCTVCDKTFRQSSSVAIHMKVHKATKDYVCMACGRGFSQKQALIRHERIHLGEKPFSCGLCGRNFTDSSVLRRHMILIHKKDPKKWRENTINNCVRRTDFYIDVLSGGTESKQTSEGNSKGMDTYMEEGGLGTISPHIVDTPPTPRSEPINMTSTTPTSVPINRTTHSQSSPREEIYIEGFPDGQNAAEPEETVDHPYSLNMGQIQPESTAELHNQATPELLDHKMADAIVHPDATLIQSHGLQTSLNDKSLVGEYITEDLSAQPMPYIMGQQSQGVYPYEQMVVLPVSDNRSQYTSLPPAMNYQQQYTTTDPSSSQPYSGYPPPQS